MNVYARILTLAVAAISLLSCDDSPTAPDDVVIQFETVVSSSSSGFVAPHQQVIRTDEEWARSWELVHAGRIPIPPRPDIDFEREMVVLVAMGASSNGCYRVEVEAIRLRDTMLDVEVAELEPAASCGCTQAITQPVHVVRLESVMAAASFLVHRQQLRC